MLKRAENFMIERQTYKEYIFAANGEDHLGKIVIRYDRVTAVEGVIRYGFLPISEPDYWQQVIKRGENMKVGEDVLISF
jgi:hypothetical protein